jgi:spore maturation protein CgeB
MESLDIAFFGSSLISAYWNGAATYYRGLTRALARRGHRISFYEPDAWERKEHRDIPDPDWARSVIYSARTEENVDRALNQARGADLIVKCSGVGVWDEYLESGVFRVAKPGARVAFLDVDAPATLERVHSNSQDPYLALIPRFDYIFTYGGGEPVVSAYRKLGARECIPVYNALDPETHHPVPPEARFQCDLSFLGNRLPDREARVDEYFLRAAMLCEPPFRSTESRTTAAERPVGFRSPDSRTTASERPVGFPYPDSRTTAAERPVRFLLGGSGWGDKALPPNVHWAGHVYTSDHNAFNSSSKAVLNIARDSMARVGFSPATRVFEAAGAGACILTDAWTGIELFLEPGEEIIVVHDGDDVARTIRDLSEERARAIGEAGRRRILASHTYDHRAKLLEDVLARTAHGVGAAR